MRATDEVRQGWDWDRQLADTEQLIRQQTCSLSRDLQAVQQRLDQVSAEADRRITCAERSVSSARDDVSAARGRTEQEVRKFLEQSGLQSEDRYAASLQECRAQLREDFRSLLSIERVQREQLGETLREALVRFGKEAREEISKCKVAAEEHRSASQHYLADTAREQKRQVDEERSAREAAVAMLEERHRAMSSRQKGIEEEIQGVRDFEAALKKMREDAGNHSASALVVREAQDQRMAQFHGDLAAERESREREHFLLDERVARIEQKFHDDVLQEAMAFEERLAESNDNSRNQLQDRVALLEQLLREELRREAGCRAEDVAALRRLLEGEQEAHRRPTGGAQAEAQERSANALSERCFQEEPGSKAQPGGEIDVSSLQTRLPNLDRQLKDAVAKNEVTTFALERSRELEREAQTLKTTLAAESELRAKKLEKLWPVSTGSDSGMDVHERTAEGDGGGPGLVDCVRNCESRLQQAIALASDARRDLAELRPSMSSAEETRRMDGMVATELSHLEASMKWLKEQLAQERAVRVPVAQELHNMLMDGERWSSAASTESLQDQLSTLQAYLERSSAAQQAMEQQVLTSTDAILALEHQMTKAVANCSKVKEEMVDALHLKADITSVQESVDYLEQYMDNYFSAHLTNQKALLERNHGSMEERLSGFRAALQEQMREMDSRILTELANVPLCQNAQTHCRRGI